MSSFPSLDNTCTKKKVVKLYDKTIGNRGYVIRKSILTEAQIIKIKKDLSVSPITFGDYGPDAKEFKLYCENDSKLYMPKYYGIKHFGEPDKNKFIDDCVNINLTFKKEMRENQLPVIDAFMKSTETITGGGLICLGCGYGKTIIALKLISLIGKKALIIVHKEFLVHQWMERIHEFLPEAKVGKIQQNVVDVEGKDIVIAMLQSISMKDYPEDTFKSFGFVCIDECHHLGAEVFSRALPKITTKHMLGLSATPDRKDGLRKVFEYYLGGMVFCIRGREKEEVKVKLIKYHCEDAKYKQMHKNFKGQLNCPKMINQLVEDPDRFELVISELKKVAVEGRNILILSDRRGHLDEIYKRVIKDKIGDIGYYVGGMKEKALVASSKKQIILGTYSMASEGMDIPTLNTVILATPKSDVEQSVGRILREKKETRRFVPLIIDIVDQIANFIRQGQARTRHFKGAEYSIDTYETHGDNEMVFKSTSKVSTLKTKKTKKDSFVPQMFKKNDYKSSTKTQIKSEEIVDVCLFD
jgi:superfamily II DNA or RNA helicase